MTTDPWSELLADLDQIRGYTSDLLDSLQPEDWFRQPAAGVNPIAWQVGHLAFVEYGLCLRRLRGPADADAELIDAARYSQQFGKGSLPSGNADDYPSPGELRDCLNAVHQRVMQELPTLDPALLDQTIDPPHPMFSTCREAIRFCPKHEMLHAGQIGLLRRLFGYDFLR